MREVIQVALEVAGMVMVVAAVAVALWPFSPALSFAAAGIGLLGASYLLERTGGNE